MEEPFMRRECIALHTKADQRIDALEDYQSVQNGSLERMEKALEKYQEQMEALRTRLTYILVVMIFFVALATPDLAMQLLDRLFK